MFPKRHLAILDKHLVNKSYLVAEQFTLADVCYAPFLEFLPLMEIDPPKAHPMLICAYQGVIELTVFGNPRGLSPHEIRRHQAT